MHLQLSPAATPNISKLFCAVSKLRMLVIPYSVGYMFFQRMYVDFNTYLVQFKTYQSALCIALSKKRNVFKFVCKPQYTDLPDHLKKNFKLYFHMTHI